MSFFTGYMKIPEIDGESQRVEHEEWIDIGQLVWKVDQPSNAQVGSGRTQARAIVSGIKVTKIYDASSPYIALSAMQGKSFDEVICQVRRDSGETHLDYLTITMTNCVISGYEILGATEEKSHEIYETVEFSFENINIKYIVQDDAHNAGDEHEVEFDVAAGV